jgi:D-cysteine desulfhydrase
MFGLEKYTLPDWIDSASIVQPPASVVRLARLPTPVEQWHLPETPEDAKVLIKRDDLTGDMLSGGNKIRKLDFLIANAIETGCNACVTVGGTQSNHARATVAACRRVGLSPYLVLRDDSANHTEPDSGNMFLDRVLGAQIQVFPRNNFVGADCLSALAESLKATHKPYVIPAGGSCALGCWGYIECFAELCEQVDLASEAHTVVAAVGSGGTGLGLAVANALWKSCHSAAETSIRGYTVCDSPDYFYNSFDQTLPDIVRPASLRQSRELIELKDAKGDGYGRSTDVELQFLSRVARETGILLDPSYTGKAALQLSRDLASGELSRRAVVFVHTGGAPSSFAYKSQISKNLVGTASPTEPNTRAE